MTSKPTEMELRCARAAFEVRRLPSDNPWEDQSVDLVGKYVVIARAVIRTMREPTEGMKFASVQNYNYAMAPIIQTSVSWEKMIDAASPPVKT